jgi:hypothetical protein
MGLSFLVGGPWDQEHGSHCSLEIHHSAIQLNMAVLAYILLTEVGEHCVSFSMGGESDDSPNHGIYCRITYFGVDLMLHLLSLATAY